MSTTFANLQDPWALLNASPDAIREAVATSGETFPPGQVEDLLTFLADLRQLYRWAATGTAKDAVKRGDFWEVEARLGQALHIYFGAWRAAFLVGESGSYLPAWKRLVPPVGVTSEELARAASPSVFVALEKPLEWLLNYLPMANSGTVYVCRWCGKVGRARRATRRFCNDRCRRSWNYRRTGT